jgi:hypothetical protein
MWEGKEIYVAATIYFLILRGNFGSLHALPSISLFIVHFSLPFKYFLQGILHISFITAHTYINVTRDAHALRLTTGQMQFSINFYNSKLRIPLLRHYLHLWKLSFVS